MYIIPILTLPENASRQSDVSTDKGLSKYEYISLVRKVLLANLIKSCNLKYKIRNICLTKLTDWVRKTLHDTRTIVSLMPLLYH